MMALEFNDGAGELLGDVKRRTPNPSPKHMVSKAVAVLPVDACKGSGILQGNKGRVIIQRPCRQSAGLARSQLFRPIAKYHLRQVS